jgi:cytoskeleton protein RodZ
MVENFGSYLKHERELRGVPLEEISGATKIHIRYLKALEENSFDQLPGEVFIKGYIRSYANTIGSDVEEMLNIYKESVELNKQENIPQSTSSFTAKPKTLLAYGLLILAITGLLFGVGFLIKNGIEDSSGKSETDNVPIHQKPVAQDPSISTSFSAKQLEEETIDIPVEKLVEPEKSELIIPSNLPDQSVRKEELDEASSPPPQDVTENTTPNLQASLPDLDSQNPQDIEKTLKLLVRAKEISWFNMTIDDFREEDFILPAGTEKIFWGNELIRLTVGNKTGVELFLNGKALSLPESKDKVVKDFIINSKLVE